MRTELKAVFDKRKSFYGKAEVEVEGGVTRLFSYNHLIATLKNGECEFTRDAWYSRTTRRHVTEFCKQNNIATPY